MCWTSMVWDMTIATFSLLWIRDFFFLIPIRCAWRVRKKTFSSLLCMCIFWWLLKSSVWHLIQGLHVTSPFFHLLDTIYCGHEMKPGTMDTAVDSRKAFPVHRELTQWVLFRPKGLAISTANLTRVHISFMVLIHGFFSLVTGTHSVIEDAMVITGTFKLLPLWGKLSHSTKKTEFRAMFPSQLVVLVFTTSS